MGIVNKISKKFLLDYNITQYSSRRRLGIHNEILEKVVFLL